LLPGCTVACAYCQVADAPEVTLVPVDGRESASTEIVRNTSMQNRKLTVIFIASLPDLRSVSIRWIFLLTRSPEGRGGWRGCALVLGLR
jgi:hypothetical protein